MAETAILDERLATWLPTVVLHGLQQADRNERVAGLLPDDFSEGMVATVDQMCDGKLLCALAISAEPSLAKGPTGLAVPARLAFFQAFCRNLGVPDVHIFSPPDLWPKPSKNPRALFDCLGAVAAALAEREDCTAPELEGVTLSGAAEEAAVAKADAGPIDEAVAAMNAQIAAMAPKKKSNAESAFEECARMRKEAGADSSVLALVNANGGKSDVQLAKSVDNDHDAKEEAAEAAAASKVAESAEAAEPAGKGYDKDEPPEAPADIIESFVYIPPDDAPEFQTDALPVFQGHLTKKSVGQKRWMVVNLLRMGGWDKRFYILRDMHLLWWEQKEHAASPEAARADGGDKCKGVINFVDTPVTLEVVKDSETHFVLRPSEGNEARRMYEFDAAGSEHDRAQWMESLHAHLEHAARVREESEQWGEKKRTMSVGETAA